MSELSKRMTITLPATAYRDLKKLAAHHRRNVSEMTRQILYPFLDREVPKLGKPKRLARK